MVDGGVPEFFEGESAEALDRVVDGEFSRGDLLE